MEWKDVMAFGVHSDRVVIIEGPVGYKRTYMFPGASFDTRASRATQDAPVEG
jgi:hypothetical protein